MTPVSTQADGLVLITGKDTLVLDDPGRLAFVSQGRADVFFVTLDESGIPDARRHMARLKQGDAAPGMAGESSEGQFIMAGIGEAHIRLESLENALKQDPEKIAALVSGWCETCFKSAARDMKIPRDIIMEGQEGEIALPAGKSLRPAGQGWWLTGISGGARFLDIPVQNLPLALPETGWIDAESDARLTLTPGEKLLVQADGVAAIQAFHRTVSMALISQQGKAAEANRRRYAQQLEGDRYRTVQTIQGMAGILTGQKKTFAGQGLAPLLAACVCVGTAAGISVAEDSIDPETGGPPELEDIARHNGFRTREVVIAEKWWNKDHGPILAFREKDGSPVALIPNGYQGYLSVDPSTGERSRVNWTLADGLSPKAYTFYRPFPHQPLNWFGLVKFGIFRGASDFIWLLAMGSLAGLLGLLTPLATGIILGTFIPSAAKSDILQLTVILVATALAIAMFNVVKGIATIRMEGRMDLNIQAAVWDRLLTLPVPFFRQFSAGDLAIRAMGITAIREILSGTTLNAILTLIFSSFNLLFIFYYDWQMAVVAVCLTGIGAFVTVGAGLLTIYFQKSLFEIQGRISGIMLQFICGINKLRTTGTEERAFSVFAGEYTRQKQMNFNSGMVDVLLLSFNAAFPVLVSMVLFAWYYWLRPGNLTVAEFVAFSTAYTTFQTALLQVSVVMPSTANIIPLYQRARPILNALP